MKQISLTAFHAFILFALFTACSKEIPTRIPPKENDGPVNKPDTTLNPGKVPLPADSVDIRIRASVKIGTLTYDSIPSILSLTSWDSNLVAHQREISLMPGTNIIRAPKSHIKFRFGISVWGITGERVLARNELDKDLPIILGGSKAPKKLRREESFRYIQGSYLPDAKTEYIYEADKLIRMEHFRKYPQHSELHPSNSKDFKYNAGLVEAVYLLDSSGKRVGITEFFYDGQGRVVNMKQDSYGNQTYGSAASNVVDGNGELVLDYLFDNGHAMEYKMTFSGGNKIQDAAKTSTGGTEGGRYSYDHFINPFAHLGIPDLYFSYASQNNLTGQQKGYGGNIPSAVPYKYDYRYDADGYPVELVKSYRNFISGEHLYKIKTVYTY